MVRTILYKYLLKAILIALLALILFGVLPVTSLVVILILFVGLRFASILAEVLRKPISPERLDTMLNGLICTYEKLTSEQRKRRAFALKLNPQLSARELAQAQINQIVHSYVPPRGKRELAADALGVVAFAILLPLDIALYTHDFFSFRIQQGWEATIVVAICVGLYALPFRWLKPSELRIWWWTLPCVVGFVALNYAIQTRHPYLNPFNPDHNRLAAERVLSLKNNVIAGRHADWVLRYARQLDEQGQSQQAIHFYREGLRLDANDRAAATRLAILEAQSSGENQMQAASATAAFAPYWTANNPIIKPARRQINSKLENVEGCTVIVVAVGQVPDELLDSVGYVVHNELGLPVYISPDVVPVPPYTRVRGLATGAQWDESTIVQAFTNAVKVFPRAPIKYVLLTPVDIYMDDVNYVFSTTYPWGAVVSSARFGNLTENDSLLRQRTAKQTLCALLKSFGIPASPDRNCVTSYTRSLEEFDTKGNRPDTETMQLFQQAVGAINNHWQKVGALH